MLCGPFKALTGRAGRSARGIESDERLVMERSRMPRADAMKAYERDQRDRRGIRDPHRVVFDLPLSWARRL